MADDFERLWVPLRGSLVRLEPLRDDHEPGLWEAAQENDWTWMTADAASSRQALHAWVAAQLAAAEQRLVAPFTTIRAADGRILGGTTFLEIRPEHRRLEIGSTWLARSAWGSGANVEAKLLQLGHAFSLGYRRVEFKTHPDNARSRGALTALPARPEGILRKHIVMAARGDEPRDSAYYSVLDDEWPEVRANLERRLARLQPA